MTDLKVGDYFVYKLTPDLFVYGKITSIFRDSYGYDVISTNYDYHNHAFYENSKFHRELIKFENELEMIAHMV